MSQSRSLKKKSFGKFDGEKKCFHINGSWQTNASSLSQPYGFNTLKLKQNGWHFSDIFKQIFLNENSCISIQISFRCVTSISSVNGLVPSRRQAINWTRPWPTDFVLSNTIDLCNTRFIGPLPDVTKPLPQAVATYCGLMIPYGDINPGQRWFR